VEAWSVVRCRSIPHCLGNRLTDGDEFVKAYVPVVVYFLENFLQFLVLIASVFHPAYLLSALLPVILYPLLSDNRTRKLSTKFTTGNEMKNETIYFLRSSIF
jgi:hypothetical protein